MKKTYTPPKTKTIKMQGAVIICASPDCMTINGELGDDYENDAYAW